MSDEVDGPGASRDLLDLRHEPVQVALLRRHESLRRRLGEAREVEGDDLIVPIVELLLHQLPQQMAIGVAVDEDCWHVGRSWHFSNAGVRDLCAAVGEPTTWHARAMKNDNSRQWAFLTPFVPGDVLAAQARQVESAGMAGIFVPQIYSSPFMGLGYCAAVTEHVQLASGIAIAFTRSPFETAMTTMDLDRVAGGRFILGLGTSIRAWVEGLFGMPGYGKPVAHMRETIEVIRLVIAKSHTGELDRYDGEHHQHDWSVCSRDHSHHRETGFRSGWPPTKRASRDWPARRQTASWTTPSTACTGSRARDSRRSARASTRPGARARTSTGTPGCGSPSTTTAGRRSRTAAARSPSTLG
jgi:hypothetical protein